MDQAIDFLLDNPAEESLTKRFISMLKEKKEYNFAIQVFKQESDARILESVKALDTIDYKNLVPTRENKEELKMFICQSVGVIVRRISELLFYGNEKPVQYFLDRLESPALVEIVDRCSNLSSKQN